MLRHYLLIAYRNLLRHRVFSIINITGLATGMAACLLITLFLRDELTFDAFHDKADRIFRVTTVWSTPQSSQHLALSSPTVGPTLLERYPEVEDYVRLHALGQVAVRQGERQFLEEHFYETEPRVFAVFTYPLLAGHAPTALQNPHSLVLTHKLAQKYFGGSDPLGQTLKVGGTDYQITGVMADPPANTHLPVGAFLAAEMPQGQAWMQFGFFTYVLLNKGSDEPLLRQRLAALQEEFYAPITRAWEQQTSFSLEMQPLQEVYFTKDLVMDTVKGDRQYLYIFGVVALLLLLIVLSNYVNLATVHALERGREVGVRKTIGAGRGQVVGQFQVESLVQAFLAGGLAFTLVQLLLPVFNQITGKEISLAGGPYLLTLGLALGLLLLLTVLTSFYPAWVMASFRPVKVLKGTFAGQPKGMLLRQGLITGQFVICAALLTDLFGVSRQMTYIRQHDLGYRKEQVLKLNVPLQAEKPTDLQSFKNELLRRQEVGQVSLVGSSGQPLSPTGTATLSVMANGVKQEHVVHFTGVDAAFFDLLGLTIVKGRSYRDGSPHDLRMGVVVNEAFTRATGIAENPVGVPVEVGEGKGEIIGVVADFHYSSLHSPIEPLALLYNEAPGGHSLLPYLNPTSLLVRLQPRPQALQAVQEVWEAFVPDHPFDYQFLEAYLEAQYRREENMFTLFGYFSGLAILIALLGLFGLASYATARRTKEIGIRKVLGASLSQMVILLSRDFMKVVLLANLLAWPLAWWGLREWLQNYAFRIDLHLGLFLGPSLLVLLIALLTVGLKTWGAARANPVQSLRYE